jgi:hypothetical protein
MAGAIQGCLCSGRRENTGEKGREISERAGETGACRESWHAEEIGMRAKRDAGEIQRRERSTLEI